MRGVCSCDSHRIRAINRMAIQALFETVLLAANTPQRGFITLVFEQFHVVSPHEIDILNTVITLAHGYNRQQRCSSPIRINRTGKGTRANQHNQQNEDAGAAWGQGLFPQPHLDVA